MEVNCPIPLEARWLDCRSVSGLRFKDRTVPLGFWTEFINTVEEMEEGEWQFYRVGGGRFFRRLIEVMEEVGLGRVEWELVGRGIVGTRER